MQQWIVTPEESDLSLQNFLKKNVSPSLSGKQIKREIENQRARVNQMVERFSSRKVKKGDRVSFQSHKKVESTVFSEKRILYLDDESLVYNKPVGIASDESGLLSQLLAVFPSLYLVHRLDKGTSGAIVFARTHRAYIDLCDQFRSRTVMKEYYAVVFGSPKSDSGVVDCSLEKKRMGQSQIYSQQGEGKRAITNWQCLQRGQGVSLFLCRPKTGRTHQIRVHLRLLGHPILGDGHYYRRQPIAEVPSHPLLHASLLSFVSQGKRVAIKASLPHDFVEFIQRLFPSLCASSL